MSLLRYTKEKIDQDIIEVDIWERIEFFFQDNFNKLINRVKVFLIVGTILVILYFLKQGTSVRSLDRPELLYAKYESTTAEPFSIQDDYFLALDDYL